ncbi:MAG: surfeit locus 1 family protein [Paracoccaceae bacterium]|jgi:surfeit locus 1 family protein
MFRQMIAPLLFGIVGVAILLNLGIWQSKRLIWKETILTEIDERIAMASVPLPDSATEEDDEYLTVWAEGHFLPGEIHVLTSSQKSGPGYRVITRFDLGARIILVDRGFIPQSEKDTARAPVGGKITGNLSWPDEVDAKFTPKPNLETNIWFARDLPAMAAYLKAEHLLIVLRPPSVGDEAVIPWPITRTGIPNNHLNYAITWFLLAVAWFGMTGYWLWRIRRQSV